MGAGQKNSIYYLIGPGKIFDTSGKKRESIIETLEIS
jgi:hypothetical protein